MSKLVLFVNSNAQGTIYQGLADRFTAIEPPVWSLLLAGACRAKGYGVAILDCIAENLSFDESVERINEVKPDLVCFVTYGPNPNSGTTQMTGTIKVAQLLKEKYPSYKIMSIGSHTSALPHEVLNYTCFDFISYNEGVKCLLALLETDFEKNLYKIPALGWKDYETGINRLNPGVGSLVSTEEMDHLMPDYPWELLPYKEKLLDLYRAHNWVPGYIEGKRTPYAAIYSSLGCQFSCQFCMISVVNRTDPTEGIHAGHSSTMRFWSPERTLKEIDKLLALGVQTLRFSDEMLLLNKKYYVPIFEGMKARGLENQISSWCYSRVDTVNKRFLDLAREAGIKYLAIGIESASQDIRLEITKGSFKDVNITDISKLIEDHGINVAANYIFGFPHENIEHLQKTLDLAISLNSTFANFYCNTALPGSAMYYEAKTNNWKLPDTFEGYSFHSYDTVPLPTKYLTGAEVLKFRDEAWLKYFSRPEYHDVLRTKFGEEAVKNVKDQCEIRLKRKVLGDNCR